jgi:hypothetical protein
LGPVHELDEGLLGVISFQTGIDLENGRLIDAIIALLNDYNSDRYHHI